MKAIKVQIIGLVVILCFGFSVVVIAGKYNSEVYQAQKKLSELGYNPGNPDGIWGKKTEKALQRFQKESDLPATGKLDKKTEEKLGLRDDAVESDKVTIVTPNTVARLCPYPNCGQNQHITRIPKGTVLEVKGIMDVQSGRLPPVKWFEVTYKGKKGWISIFDTDKQ